MKTVFINGSPKKRFSASAYFLAVQRFFVKGNVTTMALRNRSDHSKIIRELHDADAVVFCLPLYVDGIPSHVLSFMKELEGFLKENKLNLRVYALSNCGFIEGRQCCALMKIFENFCARTGLVWGGGIGVGGGVMMNILQYVFFLQVFLLGLNIVLNGVTYGEWLPVEAFVNFAINVGTILFFNAGFLWFSARQGRCINQGLVAGEKFTRTLVPSIIFFFCANLFFLISSFFEGGLFRGWLKAPPPNK